MLSKLLNSCLVLAAATLMTPSVTMAQADRHIMHEYTAWEDVDGQWILTRLTLFGAGDGTLSIMDATGNVFSSVPITWASEYTGRNEFGQNTFTLNLGDDSFSCAWFGSHCFHLFLPDGSFINFYTSA